MDEKKLISQLYCKIRNDNKTSKSIINDSYRKLKHNLCKIYKTMDVDFDSEMLKVMDEVIIYCSIYMTFRNFLSFDIIRDVLLENYDNVMKSNDTILCLEESNSLSLKVHLVTKL